MSNLHCVFCRFVPACLVSIVFFGHSPPSSAETLRLTGQVNAATGTGGVAFDSVSDTILSISQGLTIQVHAFNDGKQPSLVRAIDLAATVPGSRFISSVDVDPLGRGFAIATVIPELNDANVGKAVLFSTTSGNILKVVDAGFNPDNVTFSQDGTRAVVVNEGEPGATTDPAGSLSVLDLSSVTSAADLAGLSQAQVGTWDFSAANLAAGVSLNGLRIEPGKRNEPWLDIEPESASILGHHAYVTLQENNGVGRFDLTTHQWTAIYPLGAWEQLVDASDRDSASGGPSAAIDDLVFGVPLPDGIASFTAQGVPYVITGNEGDARTDFEFADHGVTGNPFIDAAAIARLSVRYTLDPAAPADPTQDAILGRLKISPIDGDTDGDGDIDQPTMLGTRSFSIWNAVTGERAYDSASLLEQITLTEVPTLFNADGQASRMDTRSDNRGPEPESVAVGQIGNQTFAFVALERTGGIMMFDVTDPGAVSFVDYLNTHLTTGAISPEGLAFVGADKSPDGANYLLVGYDGTGSIEVIAIAVPEPSAGLALLSGITTLALVRRRTTRP